MGVTFLVAMIFLWLSWKPNKPICDARKIDQAQWTLGNHGKLDVT